MTGADHQPIREPAQFGWLWWLPPDGYGNGLDDHGWAPVLDVDPRVAMILLDAFRAAGVPRTRPASAPARASSDPSRPSYRIWVGTSAYGQAEETLLAVMPELIKKFGPGAVR